MQLLWKSLLSCNYHRQILWSALTTLSSFPENEFWGFLKWLWYLSIAISWLVALQSRGNIGLERLLILQKIFVCLSKAIVKTLKQNVKFVQAVFISHLVSLRPTLGYWQGSRLTHLMLIGKLLQVRHKSFNQGKVGWQVLH